MGYLLLAPIVVVAVISIVAVLRRAPAIAGTDPEQLRTLVDWRDAPIVAADVAGDAHEQLRQIVGALAERDYIFASSIDRGKEGPIAIVDVRELRFELRARVHRGGRWLLWVNERGQEPQDSDDLRELLTGLYRVLEARRGEDIRWHRREQHAATTSLGAPSPFYIE